MYSYLYLGYLCGRILSTSFVQTLNVIHKFAVGLEPIHQLYGDVDINSLQFGSDIYIIAAFF